MTADIIDLNTPEAADEAAQRDPDFDEVWDAFEAELVDPLDGLATLGPIALRGSARIRELAAQAVRWTWQDYAVAGTIVVLAGPPAGGKTTLLLLLLLARAHLGEPIELLGRSVLPAPVGQFVVLIEGEHGEASIARKILASAKLLGVGTEAIDRLIIVARKAVTLGSEAWKDVEQLIAAGSVSDLAIDTIARCAPSDANNEAEQVQVFDAVARAIEKAPVDSQPTAWLLAHTRKRGADELEDVSGSSQRVGQADSVIMVQPERDTATGQVKSSSIVLLKAREDPERYPEAMCLEIADGRLVSGPRGAKADVKPEDLARVRSHITEHGWPGSAKRLAEGAGLRHATVYACCRALEAEGVLVPRPPKSNGRHNGWEHATGEDAL